MNWIFLFLCFLFAHPGFSQDADELEVDKVIAEREAKAKIQALVEKTAIEATETNYIDKLKESSILDEKVQAQLKKTLLEAKLWERKPEEVRKIIEEGSKGKAAEKVFKQFPKLLDFATDILRDRQAMPKLVDLIGKKQALKQYFIIWLAIVVGAWLIKKYFFPPEPNFMRRAFTSIMFSTVTTCTTLTAFYMFFKEELDPSLRIFIRHFL